MHGDADEGDNQRESESGLLNLSDRRDQAIVGEVRAGGHPAQGPGALG